MANEKFTNVFEEFFKVKSYLERNGDLYGDIPKEFVKKLEQYFNSYVWARDKIDRSLYLRAGQHLSIPDIADATRRKVSTLKGRVQQLSHKICDKLFDGSPLNTDLLSKDNQTLLHFMYNIELATYDFNYYSEFDDEILYKIQTKCNEPSSGEYSKEDVLQVIATYARFSQKSIDSWFNHLNPCAVQFVNDQLQSGELNKELKEYIYMLGRAGYQQITNKAIELTEKATEGVVHE